MTLGEVEQMTRDCLGGKSFQDADPLQLGGAVMFMTQRRDNPLLDWETFKNTTRMADIKAFSETMNEDDVDPTNGVMNSIS